MFISAWRRTPQAFIFLRKNFGPVLTTADTAGERITIEGRVIDGSGTPVRDVLLEIWQANAAGRYNHPDDRQQQKAVDPAFRGWGRTCSDFTSGIWRFETIKPGPVVGRDGRLMAPHVNLWVVARGINIGLNTRMYFADEHAAQRQRPGAESHRVGGEAQNHNRRARGSRYGSGLSF
ncbi:Protocatechuate 3,4-dioxygenase alpha chain [Serratia liquefaciens]|nr:Protocatechuate 3,4-dioxygenase alpha chain [Serratia liquefaciens]